MPISRRIRNVRMVLVWLRRQLHCLYWQFTSSLDCDGFSLHFSSRWRNAVLIPWKLTVMKEKIFLRSAAEPPLQSNHFSWTRTNNWALERGWKKNTFTALHSHLCLYHTLGPGKARQNHGSQENTPVLFCSFSSDCSLMDGPHGWGAWGPAAWEFILQCRMTQWKAPLSFH